MFTHYSTLEVADPNSPTQRRIPGQHRDSEGLQTHLYGDDLGGKQVMNESGIELLEHKQSQAQLAENGAQDIERAGDGAGREGGNATGAGRWKRFKQRRFCGLSLPVLVVGLLLILGVIGGVLGGIIPRTRPKEFRYPEPDKWYKIAYIQHDDGRHRALEVYNYEQTGLKVETGWKWDGYSPEQHWQFRTTYQKSPEGNDYYWIYNRNFTDRGPLAMFQYRSLNFTQDLSRTDLHFLWWFSTEHTGSMRKNERTIKNGNGSTGPELFLGHNGVSDAKMVETPADGSALDWYLEEA